MKIFRYALIALIFLGFALGFQAAPELYADYKEAVQKYQQGQYVEAAAAFRAEVEAFPNWWFVQYYLGKCNLKLEKYDQALIEYNKAKGLAKEDQEVFATGYDIAQVYYKQNKLSASLDALKAVEGAATQDAEKKSLYGLMGNIYYSQKKYGDAVPVLERSAAVSDDPKLLFKIGYSYYSLGEYEKAYQTLNQAVTKDSKNTSARYWMGVTALTLGRTSTDKSKKSEWYNKAVTQGEQLTRLKPGDTKYIGLTGQAYLGAKQYDKAIAQFRKALQSDPGDCQSQHNLANALLGKKSFGEAEAAFKKVIQCKPGDASAYNSLGYIYEQFSKDFAQKAKKDSSQYDAAVRNCDLALTNYEKSRQKKSSSAVSTAIERVQGNREIYAGNKTTDAENQAIAEANRIVEEENQILVDEFGDEVLEAGEVIPDTDESGDFPDPDAE